MATFATRLKEMRQANDLSQKQLAEEIGVTAQSVSLWERGPRRPDDRTISALCFQLNVSREYLLGITDVYTPDIPSPTEEQLDRMIIEEDDNELWRMAVRMCQLSGEMRQMVKATIREAYRIDKQNDRLTPFDAHRVTVISAELLNEEGKKKDGFQQEPNDNESQE